MSDADILKSFEVKKLAYLILVGINGSWIYEALHEQLKDEEFCKNIVDNYWCWDGGHTTAIVGYARDINWK